MPSILIIEGEEIFTRGLIDSIDHQRFVVVTDDCSNPPSLLKRIRTLSPDIILFDLLLQEVCLLEILSLIRATGMSTRVVLLLTNVDEQIISDALAGGVLGILMKDASAREILRCIEAVCRGEHYVTSNLSEVLLQHQARVKSQENLTPSLRTLTRSERRVMDLVAEFKTNQEIADILSLSLRTVQNHRASLCRKLKLRGHNQLLKFASEHKGM